mgnify:CR=1 FL=1
MHAAPEVLVVLYTRVAPKEVHTNGDSHLLPEYPLKSLSDTELLQEVKLFIPSNPLYPRLGRIRAAITYRWPGKT